MKPLRIIHVANFGFKPVKAYLHNTAVKLSNGWIRAGHHVINFSDRDIAKWQTFMGYRQWGVSAANRLLVQQCRNVRPDVVAFGHADTITNETIAQIRAALPGVRMLQWNVDWVVPTGYALDNDPTSDNNKKRLLGKSALLDATFITTAGDALKEMSAHFMPNPVDLSIERCRNFETDDLPFDIFFASNAEDDRRFHCGKWRQMGEFCRDMAAAVPGAQLLLPGINGAPKVFGPDYEEALGKCRIGLNISRRNDVFLYSSDRLAQMIGNGLAVCIDRAGGYGDIFSDDEMVFYGSESELFEKLARLKRDDKERKRIAERGWKRYSELFNSTMVAQYMLDVLLGRAHSIIPVREETNVRYKRQ